MPSKIILDLTEPGMQDAVGALKKGQTVTFDDVEVSVVRNGSGVFEADVKGLTIESESEEQVTPSEEVPPSSKTGNEGAGGFDMGRV